MAHDRMTFIVHDNPAWRQEGNFITRVELSPFGFDGEVEQMWVRRGDDDLFKLCCIPFRCYGLALGDTVRLSADGMQIVELVERANHRVFRILISQVPDYLQIARMVGDEVLKLGLASEWSGDRHIAVDVPEDVQIDSLLELAIKEELASRAYWEWGDSMAFEVPNLSA